MKVPDGSFVTAKVNLPEEHPIRQGIVEGDVLHGESGTDYEIVEVITVVKSLWGSTLEFVLFWREEHGMI